MCMAELMKSIDSWFSNLIRGDSVSVKKIYQVIHYAAASSKLYTLTYLL